MSNDPQEVYEQAKAGLAEQSQLVLLSPMAYNNTYTLAVSEQFQTQHNLQTISDLREVQNSIRAGFTLEFNDREDGYVGMQKLYGI